MKEYPKITIYGQVPSKSNNYKAGANGFYKSDAVERYERQFFLQCGVYRNLNIEGFFEFYIDVYYTSMRPDLDGMLKAVLDCLQQCRAIKNDNRCVKIVAQKFVDKQNPRIEFNITEI